MKNRIEYFLVNILAPIVLLTDLYLMVNANSPGVTIGAIISIMGVTIGLLSSSINNPVKTFYYRMKLVIKILLKGEL